MDYTAIAEAADWSDLLPYVGTIAAALAIVLVAMKGARKLLSFLGR